jgi:hypothetical protein
MRSQGRVSHSLEAGHGSCVTFREAKRVGEWDEAAPVNEPTGGLLIYQTRPYYHSSRCMHCQDSKSKGTYLAAHITAILTTHL